MASIKAASVRTANTEETGISEKPTERTRARGEDAVVFGGLLALGLYLVSISLLMLVSPATFYEEIGPFNGRSDHYIRDAATFQLAFGILALLALRRPVWRLPVVIGLLLNSSLHALNHLTDIAEADPAWLGPADFIVLSASSALLIWMLVRLRRTEEAP